MQVGNAVAPPVAAALGRCLLKAAVGTSPVGEPVISVPDLAYEEVRSSALPWTSFVVPHSQGTTHWRVLDLKIERLCVQVVSPQFMLNNVKVSHYL